eukprot:GHVR01022252.1.p1 GENE.GHVR01022252.1~~GHVR01022252.1.p1  ORF type:complete len:263 (+),score=49.94 GHVR01022252.1:39-827(+)
MATHLVLACRCVIAAVLVSSYPTTGQATGTATESIVSPTTESCPENYECFNFLGQQVVQRNFLTFLGAAGGGLILILIIILVSVCVCLCQANAVIDKQNKKQPVSEAVVVRDVESVDTVPQTRTDTQPATANARHSAIEYSTIAAPEEQPATQNGILPAVAATAAVAAVTAGQENTPPARPARHEVSNNNTRTSKPPPKLPHKQDDDEGIGSMSDLGDPQQYAPTMRETLINFSPDMSKVDPQLNCHIRRPQLSNLESTTPR